MRPDPTLNSARAPNGACITCSRNQTFAVEASDVAWSMPGKGRGEVLCSCRSLLAVVRNLTAEQSTEAQAFYSVASGSNDEYAHPLRFSIRLPTLERNRKGLEADSNSGSAKEVVAIATPPTRYPRSRHNNDLRPFPSIQPRRASCCGFDRATAVIPCNGSRRRFSGGRPSSGAAPSPTIRPRLRLREPAFAQENPDGPRPPLANDSSSVPRGSRR